MIIKSGGVVEITKKITATAVAGIAVLSAFWFLPGIIADNPSQANIARPSAPSIPVVTAPVLLEREDLRLDAVGTSQAIRSVTLFAESSGEVVKVLFEAGQRVSQGDLLLELDSRDEKLALDLANVRLTDAERLMNR